MVKAIPDEYGSVTPYLIIRGASDAIAFYRRAFGATESARMTGPDGVIHHAEIRIGDATIMLADDTSAMSKSPMALGGSPVSFVLYVEDAGAAIGKAVAAGATVVRELADQIYGDRTGTVADPFGYQWHLHTHIEDVTPEELGRRAAAAGRG